MKQNTNNCEMVQDLIPLYSEGLCSGVSRKIVEEHTASCETCRQLLTQIPADAVPDTPMPDESKPFRKVHKKMKKSRLRNVILSVALAAVVIPVGYLTVGQIVKTPEIQSFETVWQSIEVRQQVKKLFSGDIEGYMERASWSNYLDINSCYIQTDEIEEIRRQDTENLKKAFDAAYGGTSIQNIDILSEHTGIFLDESAAVTTNVMVALDDGSLIEMEFSKADDGLYTGYVINAFGGEAAQQFEKAMNYIDLHQLAPFGWFETLLTSEHPLRDGTLSNNMTGVTERFQPQYHQQVEKGLTAFYEKGYRIEHCVLDLRYDQEKNMLYHDALITAADASGQAVLHTRLYTACEGLIPPEEDMITIYQDGCTDALASDLANLFG